MQTGVNPSIVRTLFKRLAALSVVAVALFASAAAWADPPGRIGRIGDVQGTVWIFDPVQGEWIAALRNRPVTSGDRLSVDRDARVEMQIGSTTVRLDGETEVEFSELNDDRVHLSLHSGSVALRLRDSEAAREFSVSTREGRFEPQRVGHYRVDQESNGSFGGVMAGAMRFEASDSALELNAGQRAEFWNERGVTHYTWTAPPGDRFAEWVANQDRQDERDAQRRGYVSPEMTGAEDLDRYGEWSRHPDYGMIWAPYRVEAGWAPYRYGQWSYVQPWGWTWVDHAPWGFAPFHYGRWVSWRGRWVWAPGQYVARPVYAPALVAWIGGPHVSIGISIGGGPSVGWIPLAPREVYVPSYRVTNVYVTHVNQPHHKWQPKPNQPVRTGPIMYTNQGVPGGVTVVSQNVLRERRPISSAVVAPVDARTISRWRSQPLQQDAPGNGRRAQNDAPPAPPSRVVATPGGAIPAAPGAARGTQWGRVGPAPQAQVRPAQPAPRSEASDTPRVRAPQADRRGDAPQRVDRAAPGQREDRSSPSREQDNARGDTRRQPQQAVQPVQPVQPAQPAVVHAPQQAERPARARGARDEDDKDERKPRGQERRDLRQQQNQ